MMKRKGRPTPMKKEEERKKKQEKKTERLGIINTSLRQRLLEKERILKK